MSTDINVAFNNKKLTIDFLVPCGGRGGVENVLNDTALYLKSLGIRVRVIQLVYNDYSWPDSSLEYYTINIDRAISDFSDYVPMCEQYLCELGAPDIIIATPLPMLTMIIKLALLNNHMNSKIISWLHGPLKVYDDNAYGGLECLKYADLVMVLSHSSYQYIKKNNSTINVVLVKNPIDFSSLIYHTNYKPECRTLAFIGRLSKEKNVDIACVGYYQCYMNKIVKGNFCKGKLYSGENLISEICEDGYYNLAVWNKLFKRSIFDKIRFPDNRYEDAFIFFEILERVSKVYISQETKYFYRQRKDSIMNKVFDDNVLDNITYRELFLETAHKRYQRLIPLMSFNCKMGYFFVLGILAKSKDIKNKFELARELQRKMREGIKEVIKSDKVNFNGKIAYTSLAVSFKLYQYLFELNKFIKKLSGKQNILYP